MQITVTGRHLEITDALRDYAMDRVTQGLAEFPRVESVHVILDVEKYRHLAELVVQARNHIKVDAREESDNMYASIDGAVEKAEKQLRRLRDKVQDHKSRESIAEVELGIQAAKEAEAE